jgi:hypothetical protein
MGWIIVALGSLVGDSGTTFKDIRDVRVSEDQGSFLLTDWEHESLRVTVEFEEK